MLCHGLATPRYGFGSRKNLSFPHLDPFESFRRWPVRGGHRAEVWSLRLKAVIVPTGRMIAPRGGTVVPHPLRPTP